MPIARFLRSEIHSSLLSLEIFKVHSFTSLSFASTSSRASKLTILFQYSRLARRGGVKRISAGIYDEVRVAMEDRLRLVSFQSSSLNTGSHPAPICFAADDRTACHE